MKKNSLVWTSLEKSKFISFRHIFQMCVNVYFAGFTHKKIKHLKKKNAVLVCVYRLGNVVGRLQHLVREQRLTPFCRKTV